MRDPHVVKAIKVRACAFGVPKVAVIGEPHWTLAPKRRLQQEGNPNRGKPNGSGEFVVAVVEGCDKAQGKGLELHEHQQQP
eukprot:9504146-Pyramimonas_sp.AAC.2